MTKPLALLGLPGCGKSYWGKKLAQHLGLSFLDLDQLIEQEAGMTITEIFHEGGEYLFRSIESSTLFSLSQSSLNEKFILSLGGGTPAFGQNMNIIHHAFQSIYLNISIPTLVQNLINDTSNHRPLVQKTSESELQQYLEKLKQEREVAYLLADYMMHENELSLINFEKILNDLK